MKSRCKIRICLIATLLLLVPAALAQLQVGENTTLKMNGIASLGWNSVYDGIDTNSLAYGFSGNLSGDYYDERFLNWSVNPFINQSRLNSNYNSTSTASGVTAQANLLNNSRTPMQFTYAFDRNSEGTFNVPGSTGSYQTVGNGQAIGVTAAYLPEDWPSIQASFNRSGSSYEVIGNPGGGSGHSTAFGLSSGYDLWGTNLFGLFSMVFNNTDTPRFDEPGATLKTDGNQNNLQFGASRRLTNWSSGSVSVGRSHLNANYEGEQVKATYDNVSALLSAQPMKRLSLNFHTNYSSNLSAQFLSNILTGANGLAAPNESQGLSFTSSFLTYGLTSGYTIARNLTATGYINRQVQGQQGLPDTTSTTMGTGLVWSHKILGGSLGAAYGVGYTFTPIRLANQQTHDQSFVGQNASASYTRRVMGFSASASGSYGHSLTTLLVGYTQTNYSANVSLSRSVAYWTVTGSASYNKAKVDTLSATDSSAQSYNLSLSHRRLALSGHYSLSHGSGLQVGNNIVPNPVPGPLPEFLILFDGRAYGGGISYTPRRRWTMSGSYSRLSYDSKSIVSASNNMSEQFYFTTQYNFRQMWLNAGFSHVSQGFGTGTVAPTTINTAFFGVSRRFDFF